MKWRCALIKNSKQNVYRYGVWAEIIAAWFLRLKGYRVLARRYKTPVGEIDLVAKRGRSIAFIEVKARQKIDDALAAVTPSMQSRIIRAAQYFMSRHTNYGDMALRFDLMAMAPPFYIRHLDNAWRPAA